MVKKGLYLSIIAVLLLSVAGLAGCRRHSPGQKAEFMVDYVSETLDLNESQQAHLDQIKDELLEKGIQMHADKAAMHSELVAQLRSEEIDQDRLKAMVTEHRSQNGSVDRPRYRTAGGISQDPDTGAARKAGCQTGKLQKMAWA